MLLILKLLSPISPFITEKIYREIFADKLNMKDSIHLTIIPSKFNKIDEKLREIGKKLLNLNSLIWKFKKDRKISLNAPLKTIWAPIEVQPFKIDLESMHNSSFEFGIPKNKDDYESIPINPQDPNSQEYIYIKMEGKE